MAYFCLSELPRWSIVCTENLRMRHLGILKACCKRSIQCLSWYYLYTTQNEWYPRGLQISLHIRSPGLQDYDGGGGVFRSKLWSFQIWSFPKLGGWGGRGVFQSKLWSSQIWSFLKWGGVFRSKLGHLKSEVFQNGGVLCSKLWSSQIWSFPKWGWGGGFLVWNSRKGLSGEFGQKFTVWGMCTETCLCITDSLSHTTYVETNNIEQLSCIFHCVTTVFTQSCYICYRRPNNFTTTSPCGYSVGQFRLTRGKYQYT